MSLLYCSALSYTPFTNHTTVTVTTGIYFHTIYNHRFYSLNSSSLRKGSRMAKGNTVDKNNTNDQRE